ncbi:MAG TPA: type II secretion system protein GspM [Kiloniellaceae bacterium]|nr:type II secretion system protein GspM [Kiloniellaceae bacterium]
MPSLSKWGNRLTAIVLFLLVIGGIVAYGVMPVVASFRETDEALANTQELLVRFSQSAATRDSYKEQIKELGDGQALRGFYIPGATNALAAANLQEDVRAAVKNAGGEIKSTQILAVQRHGEFERVGLRVALSMKIEPLLNLLYKLEAGQPYLFVDNLEIAARVSRRRSEPEDNVDPELAVRFDIYGFLRPEVKDEA